jgi:hypothetical protein
VAKKARTPKPPRPAQSSERRVQAPQRRSGPARKSTQAAAPPGGFKYFWPTAAAAVALAIVGIALGIALTRGSSRPPKLALTTPISWKDLPALQTGKPPWPDNSATLTARIPALGLNALTQEALAFHIHAHLDVFVDGKHVAVPQLIGIHVDQQSAQASFITELHTHHTDGIVHVESAQHLSYQLGPFFGEWGVRLTSKCLGSFKGSCDNLQWWLNGKKMTGNPENLILKNHEEIVISVGKPPSKVPTSFDFKLHGV